MPTLDEELSELHLADQHIAEGRRLYDSQLARIADLRENGLPTADAEELRNTMEATLFHMERHRDMIWRRVKELQAEAADR